MMKVFKIHNKTQRDAGSKKNTVRQVLLQCGITYEVWAHVLFETGCRFIEDQVADNPVVRKQLLQEEKYRFWDWWIAAFVTDDEWIVETGMSITELQYRREKTRMSLLVVTHDNFKFYLNQIFSREEI